MRRRNTHAGFSVLEVILALALFSMSLAYTAHSVVSFTLTEDSAEREHRKLLLADEAMTATLALRDTDMDALTPGSYGLSFSDGTWHLDDTTQVDDTFVRSITLIALPHDAVDVVVSVHSVPPTGATTTLHTTLYDLYDTRGLGGDLETSTEHTLWDSDAATIGNITIHNTSEQAVTVDGVSVTWAGASGWYELSVDGALCYAVPASEAIGANSVVPCTLSIPPAETRTIDLVQFTTLPESDVVITLVLADGSERSVYVPSS